MVSSPIAVAVAVAVAGSVSIVNCLGEMVVLDPREYKIRLSQKVMAPPCSFEMVHPQTFVDLVGCFER